MIKISITLGSIGGMPVEMSMDDARKLYDELGSIFGNKTPLNPRALPYPSPGDNPYHPRSLYHPCPIAYLNQDSSIGSLLDRLT